MKVLIFSMLIIVSGCYPVRYDRQEFTPVEKKTFVVGEAILYLGIFSSSYDAFNAKNRDPWWLRIKVKGGVESHGSVFISKLKIVSREGVVLEMQDTFELKCIELEGGGVVWESVVEQSFSPDYYDEQRLDVMFEVDADGEVKTIQQQYIPKRISGRERVNLLTM